MFNIAIDNYNLLCVHDGLPNLYNEYCKHAVLSEHFNITASEGKSCFLGVEKDGGWPFLVIAQRFDDACNSFYPGALLVTETKLLFVGAGERILAYKLDPPARLWEDQANCGFWNWQRFGNTIVMSAELELAAWNIAGKKLWTMFVEPPWDYTVIDGIVTVDVMGSKSQFNLESGPKS
jgi:hypothetical protein